MPSEGPKDAKSLVSSILSQIEPAGSSSPPKPGAPALPTSEPDPGPAPQAQPQAQPQPTAPVQAATPPASSAHPGPAEAPSVEEIEALIEVYFELDAPEERDAVMEKIQALHHPVVTEFLLAVMNEDEDDYVRAQAAAELARRRVPEGIEAIENDLVDPDEPFFLENAIKTLCEIRGAGFYDTLRSMWKDPEADADTRCQAMLGMESLDLERAMADFVQLIEETTDIDTMPDDEIEIAMMAFVRHGHTAALAPLRRLAERVAAASLDPDERAELLQFVQEGIDLLNAE